MKPRAVRVTLHDVRVRFRGEPAVLVDISRGGALLRLPEPAVCNVEASLVLGVGTEFRELTVRVVRSQLDRHSLSGGRPAWLIGVEFLAPSPRDIQQLLHRLIEAHR